MSEIVVDTYKLRQFSKRITDVNNRIGRLNKRIKTLYEETGLSGLYEIKQENILSKYSSRLPKFKDYLDRTAFDFECLEKSLANKDILNSGGAQNAITSSKDNSLFGDAKTAASVMEWLDGEWVDEQLSGLPLWAREAIKKVLSEASEKFFGKTINESYDVTQKILDGDYLGALKDATEALYGAYNESRKIELNFFEKLSPMFYINSVFGMAEEYLEYVKEPSLQNLLSIGWSGSVGSVLETTGDAAWDIVKFIPGVSDWYDKHGATEMEDAFNVMYTESVRAFWGDDMADYCGTYYAQNGGLFDGLVNGFKDIKKEIDKSCEKHGGIVGVWLNGWNSIFT